MRFLDQHAIIMGRNMVKEPRELRMEHESCTLWVKFDLTIYTRYRGPESHTCSVAWLPPQHLLLRPVGWIERPRALPSTIYERPAKATVYVSCWGKITPKGLGAFLSFSVWRPSGHRLLL